MKKYLVGTIILMALTAFAIYQNASAFGPVLTRFFTYSTSSSKLVANSSTLVVATNTARAYLEISNIASKPIYCSMLGGDQNQAAVMYSGMTIFASSTMYIRSDSNPYTGPVYCIAEANASTTILER